jgi:hypothetical protein
MNADATQVGGNPYRRKAGFQTGLVPATSGQQETKPTD